MKISRLFTKAGKSVYQLFEYTLRSSVLRNPDGSVVFEMHDIEVPAHWSQMATDILAQKYFRKAGVPQFDADGNQLFNEAGEPVLGSEKSAKQVIHRLAGCWRDWGEKHGYFSSEEDAQAFYDEVAYMLLKQMASPNSPQWFNTGLAYAYGITGPAQGHYYVDPETGKLTKSRDAYTHPQPHACFIQSVSDDLVNEGGIFDLVTREARIFKYGSGTGSNFSALRGEGEPLSGGGISSGLMSFLKINDRAAGAVKSGGTTRRAAKMVILNIDHPDIEQFIDWKMVEEQKVAALVAGSRICRTFLKEIADVAREQGTDYSDPDSELYNLVQRSLNRGIPFNYIVRVLALVDQGVENIDFREYNLHYEGEAYNTVSGQNSNNSVRVDNSFMKALREDADWNLTWRTNGKIARTVKARYLWEKINYAAWSCADPGLQFDTTINEWHTSPREGRINGSNPCVTADTFVATHEGLERIGDIIGQARGVKSLDGRMHWVEKIFPTGMKPVYTLKTRSGYRINLTGDHRVFTENRGDVQACELTKDDIVRLVPGTFGTASAGSSDTAQLIGLLLGDGCITTQNLFTGEGDRREVAFLTMSKDEFRVTEWANAAVNALRPELGERNRAGQVTETATSSRVHVGSPRILNLFRSYAVLDEGSERKRLTDAAFRLDRGEQAALLRGLFTADGTVANYGEKSRYVALDSTSLELLQQVQLMLLNFGIKAKIYENRRAGKLSAILPDGKGGRKEYNVQEMYSLRISRNSRLLFEEHIGFMPESRKSEQLRELNVSVDAYRDSMTDTVASLTYRGMEEVFDLTEPETHHFTANGIAVHNCSEYMYLDDTACVAAETRISTPHGLRTVEELYNEQELGKRVVITTDTYSEHDHRRITAHRPAYVTKVGDKQTYRMVLADGRAIRVTEDHKFLTDGGEWKRVDELEVGNDRIEIRRSGNPVAFTSSDAEVERWRALGWLTGDGVFSKGNVAMVFGPKEERTGREMREEFNRMIADAYRWTAAGDLAEAETSYGEDVSVAEEELLGLSTVVEVDGNGRLVTEATAPYRTVNLSSQHNGVMQLTSKATALVAYLERHYGMKQGTAVHKDVPAQIHHVADDLKVAYLQGLFSADGCIRKAATESEVMLASSSPELLRSVQLLLSDMGIVGRISWTHPDGRKNPQGQLHLYNRQARTFLNLVGFPCSEEKEEQAREILGHPFEASPRNPRPVTVAAIEKDAVTTVYDITEPVTRSFIAEGLITHNCNLASLNLSHFYNDETGVFDVEAFKHATRLWTIVLEISVLMAQFPSKEIAQKSYDTRTLGLGYANLGTVLMTAGIPYDSDEGRAWAAAITAIMCGESYAASAEMAGELGPFNRYQRNAKDMLRVMRNHRRAAYNAPKGEYEKLTVTPVGIDHDICPENLGGAAKDCWDRALALGEQHGYRNAQVTVIAPTGTISLVMDCDTTGIEPDFALVKYKKLAGGGYFKIVNQSVPKALRKLGYTDAEIADITAYIKGYASLQGCPHINRASLKAKGFSEEKVDAVESQLAGVFDIAFAFNHYTLGEDFVKSLGFTDADLSDPGFSLLKRLGFSDAQIEEANRYVCGTMTIEGAPGLKEEHLPIFDCANKCGKLGKRFIDYMGHVNMMAAAQPFISGAISKTINMPDHATVQEVEHVYMESWKLMLKAIALYRDGSKLSQPLNVSSDLELVEEVTLRDIDVEAGHMIGEGQSFNEHIGPQHVQERIVEKVYHRADRRRLPKRRHGFVREATVGGHKVFLRTGEYEDGAIGEIFIDMYKEGASFKGLLNCFAVLASKALQYGMPLEKMVDTFTFTRFEPSGPVQGHEAIKNATSIIDYVFRAIGYEYLGREDFVHIRAVDETEGIEYGPGEGVTESVVGKLSPGRELWERQQSRKKEKKGGENGTNGAGGVNGVKSAGGTGVAQATRTASDVGAKVASAKAQGYTGEQCGNCGSMRVKQNGACHVCEECGTTSGCS